MNQRPDEWVVRVEEMYDDEMAAAFVENLPPPLRAYPNNPAALRAMRAQAK